MAGLLKPQIFSCLNCGASLEISALGSTNTVVCKKCFSSIDVSHPIYKIIKKRDEMLAFEPSIPLGTFGLLKGQKWKVIGFMVREDSTYNVQWREYLLFNPYVGFRFLFEIDDHYSLLQRLNFNPLGGSPDIQTSSFSIDKYGEFKLFNKGQATVKFVVGEFYWQVRVGEKSTIDDYISPPYIFSAESSANEINCTLGEYVSPDEIKAAFGHAKDFKYNQPWTTAQNQPNPHNENFKFNFKTWANSILAVLVIALVSTLIKNKSLIQATSLTDTDFRTANNIYVSPSFPIKGASGNVEVFLSAPVRNQYLEAGVNLVNDSTGENYSTEAGVEYYYGSDYDGSWSEGSTTTNDLISSVPAGTYHLEVETSSNMPSREMTLHLYRHGHMGWNFILIVIFLSFYPLWMTWRRRSFEVSRWENSDFSPYYSYAGDYEDDNSSSGDWE